MWYRKMWKVVEWMLNGRLRKAVELGNEKQEELVILVTIFHSSFTSLA